MRLTLRHIFSGDFGLVQKSKTKGTLVESKPSPTHTEVCPQPGGPTRSCDGVVSADSATKDRVAGLKNRGHAGDGHARATGHP
jgi:hypothetical protein